MPLTGEYELSPADWVREQTEKIFETGTTKSVGINGLEVILLTTRGVKSGKLRKVPLMRVEHDGVYAIVASMGGAPKNPTWYANVKAEPHVELQDGTVTKDYTAREVTGDEKALVVEARRGGLPELRRVPDEDRPPDPGVRAGAARRVRSSGIPGRESRICRRINRFVPFGSPKRR